MLFPHTLQQYSFLVVDGALAAFLCRHSVVLEAVFTSRMDSEQTDSGVSCELVLTEAIPIVSLTFGKM